MNKAAFSLEKPKKFNFVREVLDKQAQTNPDLTALYWIGEGAQVETFSFSQMSERSLRAGHVLKEAGLERGDLIILVVGKIPAWWDIVSACIRLGLVISPAPTSITAKDLDYRIKVSGAAALVVQDKYISRFEDSQKTAGLARKFSVGSSSVEGWVPYSAQFESAPASCPTADTDLDEDSLCYFTSGTTGYPKMAVHTHASYGLAHETTGKHWLQLSEGDLNWSMADTGWAKAAWGCYYAPWRQGAGIFIAEAERFDAEEVIALLSDHPISTFCAPPTIYRLLIQEEFDGSKFANLRHCVSAGEPLNPEALSKWFDLTGHLIYEGYGQTETVILCGALPGMEVRSGSMGKPMPGIELEIIDNDGNVIKDGTEGDLAVKIAPNRPLGLFKGYKNDPEKTKESYLDHWYLTGDRGFKDDDGYFWFLSRSDDVIISAGYRIGPFEVESALQEHPKVLENAVVASPDETRGDVVKAFVVLVPGTEPSDELKLDIQNHVKHVTAPYKYPRKVEFVEALPKTISGKIRRVELREREMTIGQSA